jgi:hypothetical protein
MHTPFDLRQTTGEFMKDDVVIVGAGEDCDRFGVSPPGSPVVWVRTHHPSTLCVWVDLNLNMRCPLLAQWDKAVGDNVVERDLSRDMAPLLDTAPGQDLDRVSKILALIDQADIEQPYPGEI